MWRLLIMVNSPDFYMSMIQNGGFQMHCLCEGACAIVSETAGMMRMRCPVNVPYHKITHTHTNKYVSTQNSNRAIWSRQGKKNKF